MLFTNTNLKEVSIFFFDKRTADKLHKPKRKETISEILRFSVRQLDRFRHPKILALVHSVEESSDTLAFATEPVLGSLANVFDYLEDRLPQGVAVAKALKDYQLLDFEIKYGLLQVRVRKSLGARVPSPFFPFPIPFPSSLSLSISLLKHFLTEGSLAAFPPMLFSAKPSLQ